MGTSPPPFFFLNITNPDFPNQIANLRKDPQHLEQNLWKEGGGGEPLYHLQQIQCAAVPDALTAAGTGKPPREWL